METKQPTVITVQTTVNAPVDKVWKIWSSPEHIVKWNSASDDWHTPKATNDLRTGGRFISTMAAKDGSVSFDFEGVYSDVRENELIEYTMLDGRKARVEFAEKNGSTQVTESFDAETENTEELQRNGWQAILDNFKKYCESV
jgi:uncharacterized protein YndB with AHSA1/START domain